MEQPAFVGIDVAKDTLAICTWGRPEVTEIANTPSAIADWLSTLPGNARIGLESTSTYHRLAAGLCVSAGHTVHLLQPRDMCHYRRTVAPRGKTDSIDAQVLARYVAHEHANLRAWEPPTEEQEQMDIYLNGRAFCSRLRSSVGQVRKTNPTLSKLLEEVEKSMDRAINEFDKAIKRAARKNPGMTDGWTRIQSVDGVGPVVAAAVGNLVLKHDFKSADSLIGFVGLDPRPRESGTYKGRRRLSKRGPSEVRRLLYLAAMAGVREGKAWRPLQEAYSKRGLPRTAALCIIARKILRVIWAIWNKAGATFDASRYAGPLPQAA